MLFYSEIYLGQWNMSPDAAEMVDPAVLSQSMISSHDFRCEYGTYCTISNEINWKKRSNIMKSYRHWQTGSKRVTVLYATWIKHALFSPLMLESTVRISDACARPSIADILASHHHIVISPKALLVDMRAQVNDLWNHAILPAHFLCNKVLRTWYVPFTAIRPELRGVTLHRLLMNNRLEISLRCHTTSCYRYV